VSPLRVGLRDDRLVPEIFIDGAALFDGFAKNESEAVVSKRLTERLRSERHKLPLALALEEASPTPRGSWSGGKSGTEFDTNLVSAGTAGRAYRDVSAPRGQTARFTADRGSQTAP
jgi:hypothetical protein